MTFRSINPATGAVIAEYPDTRPAEVRAALARSAAAFARWKISPFAERAALLRRVATRLRKDRDALAALMATEMGKPLTQGVAEAEKCATACEYYAENGERFLAAIPIETEATRSSVAWRPLGPVLAIMPWNFPLWQAIRFAAPAIMAGNSVLLKHAPSVGGCANALVDLFGNDDLFQALFVDTDTVADLIRAPEVAAVTLTGSTRAGRAVGVMAGAALKKCVLELGGSDPYVVLADADLDLAVSQCVAGRLVNSGQSCIAAKRWIVVPEIADAFVARAQATLAAKIVGDPFNPRTEVGPMARRDLRDALHRQVVESVQHGAELRLGGDVPEGPGAFYPVTLLDRVVPGMPAYDEELFGPVASVVRATDERDALRTANDTSYGLGAAIFTRDAARGERLAREHLDAGLCFVNAFVRSDPRLPFGGIKESGYGRELSVLGLREFTNPKTVWVA
jgi:succinate-semialdehyde dehydrogenase/glutarate-semialdehyde dehydrogenase